MSLDGTRPDAARVVLVDDAAEVRRLVRLTLRVRGGFEVVGEARNGAEAVALVEDLDPDLVVLDLGLPDLAGKEVLTRIRERRPASKIVIFSGFEVEDRTWFAERAEGYVLKDADIDYLVDLLESLVGRPTGTEAVLSLPHELASVREARRFVSETLAEWEAQQVAPEASLVVTELAANAVVHAGTDYEVHLARTPQGVRIEVHDHGPGTPEPKPPTAAEESGRGLYLVASLSASWGVETLPDAKVVWSELPLPVARRAAG